MDIEYRQKGHKWVAEVWSDNFEEHFAGDFKEPYPEDTYVEINQWCIDTLGYHARTAYHIFEFKKRSDLDWFIIRWN